MTNKPWLDSTLPVEKRVNLLMQEMTTDEKIAQMVQISYSIVTPDEAYDWARKGAGSFLHTLHTRPRHSQRRDRIPHTACPGLLLEPGTRRKDG